MARQRKRFIAGAQCPACNALDTLMLFVEDDVETVECVQCKHRFSERDEPAQPGGQPEPVAVNKNIIGIFKP